MFYSIEKYSEKFFESILYSSSGIFFFVRFVTLVLADKLKKFHKNISRNYDSQYT